MENPASIGGEHMHSNCKSCNLIIIPLVRTPSPEALKELTDSRWVVFDVLPTFFNHDDPWVSLGKFHDCFAFSPTPMLTPLLQLLLKFTFVARIVPIPSCHSTTMRATTSENLMPSRPSHGASNLASRVPLLRHLVWQTSKCLSLGTRPTPSNLILCFSVTRRDRLPSATSHT